MSLRRDAAFLLLIICANLAEARGVSETSADFITIYDDARPAALGGAYTALSDNAAGLAYNAAGLTRADAREVTVSYSPWVEDAVFHHVSYTHPLGWKNEVFGFSLLYFNAGGFERTNELGILTGHELEAYDIAASFGYGRMIGRFLAVGGSVKFLQRTLDVHSATSYAFDLGGLYQTPIEGLTLGGAIQNVGRGLTFIQDREPLPLTIRGGASYQTFIDRVVLVADAIKVLDEELKFSVGSEIRVGGNLKFRAGWRTDDGLMKGLTVGLGATVRDVTLDYAYIPFDTLESAHKLTGSVKFGGPTTPDVYRPPERLTPAPSVPLPIARPPEREIRVIGADTVPARIRIRK